MIINQSISLPKLWTILSTNVRIAIQLAIGNETFNLSMLLNVKTEQLHVKRPHVRHGVVSSSPPGGASGSSVAQPVNRPKGGEEGVSENPRPTGTMASRRDPRAALLDESYASSEVSSATDGTGSRGDEDERDGEAPAVFFCGKCRLPVGDSLSWAGSEEERNQILLQRVNNNIIVGKEPYLDPVQKRLGCLIVNLTCRGCCSVLGMMYVSTPKKLDHKRSLFCLNVESIDSYVIGSTDQEVADLSCEGTPVTLEYQERVEQQMTEIKAIAVTIGQRLFELEAELRNRSQ